MNLDELRPVPSFFKIDGEQYELKPFSLEMQNWFQKEYNQAPEGEPYNGLQVLSDHLRVGVTDYPVFAETVAAVCFTLMKDPDYFPSLCAFKGAINGSKEGPSKTIARMFMALSECMGNAEPQYKDAEKDLLIEELKKKIVILEAEKEMLQTLLTGRGIT